MPRPLLLFLGDSITEFGANCQDDGWLCLLTNRYSRSADVVQRGMSGYSTQMFLEVVLAALVIDLATTLRPALITLWLGTNDAALPDGRSAKQHVPLDQFRQNLRALVAAFKKNAAQAKILLITPTTVDDDRRRTPDGDLDRSNAAAAEYAAVCVAVAEESGVEVLDLHTTLNEQPKSVWAPLLSDGLHLSHRGNRVVEQFLVHMIRTKFPEIQSQLDRWEFPPFQDLLDQDGTCPVQPPSREGSLSWLKWLFSR